MKLISLFFLISCFTECFNASGHQLVSIDSTSAVEGEKQTPSENDTTSTFKAKKRANRAAIMSAILPGAGQAYNRKYWKMPIIYGGFGTLIYFISTNNKEYNNYKTAIKLRNDGDPLTVDTYTRLTDQDLNVRKDFYRRNRDLSYILSGILYTLNIIDAYVDSQLLDFDVTDNLSMRTSPFINSFDQKYTLAGIQLTFTIR